MKNAMKAFAKKIPGSLSYYSFYNAKLAKRISVVNRNYPRLIIIGLTTRCNARCIYCPRQQLVEEGIRQVKDVDFELVKKIVSSVKSSKKLPEIIEPGGLGEPMLYKNLVDVLRLIRSELPLVKLYLVTNGIYFPEEVQHAIVDIGLDALEISVNFHSRDLYKKYNGVDRFETVISNVEAFLQLKGARKPNTIIQILDIFDNQKYLQEFKQFWSSRVNSNDVIYFRPLNSFAGLIDATQYTNINYHDMYPCAQIFQILSINVDGDCHPCCMGAVTTGDDPLCIGNIKEQSIDELYAQDSHVQWVRKIHKSGDFDKIPTCKRCNPWQQGPNMFFKIAGRWI